MQGTWQIVKVRDGYLGLFNDDGRLLAKIEKVDGLFQVDIIGRDYDLRFLTAEQAEVWVEQNVS